MGIEEIDLMKMFTSQAPYYEDLTVDDTIVSNTIQHKGHPLHIPSLNEDQLATILDEFTYDQLQQYGRLECVRSLNQLSSPTRKLQYPEPFIASPSFIHTDIGFIHVLHYQY